jgi:hypothetical protein
LGLRERGPTPCPAHPADAARGGPARDAPAAQLRERPARPAAPPSPTPRRGQASTPTSARATAPRAWRRFRARRRCQEGPRARTPTVLLLGNACVKFQRNNRPRRPKIGRKPAPLAQFVALRFTIAAAVAVRVAALAAQRLVVFRRGELVPPFLSLPLSSSPLTRHGSSTLAELTSCPIHPVVCCCRAWSMAPPRASPRHDPLLAARRPAASVPSVHCHELPVESPRRLRVVPPSSRPMSGSLHPHGVAPGPGPLPVPLVASSPGVVASNSDK